MRISEIEVVDYASRTAAQWDAVRARREDAPYGYVTYTGRVPSNAQIDGYNLVQRRINSFAADGGIVPEYLLNQSHYLFVEMSQKELAK